ncbi:hypothetical protein CANARDRAFT_202757 [[Candida] arabinofermentans NRRL YB-2248]|uniref:2,5-diamino-6-ribosylamino-4(3H)-pyrimidinone 5'-phosphate reductase n=1 Tax=[Candida] arabinofermentans NRRL YB-2248 TaxID=983967 RepID=A0A1E4SVS3_9ASCO|nr:hypothetical protein CANARDRAFT_202757 [[Candida] arabinofermentans NRRL YB-2248]
MSLLPLPESLVPFLAPYLPHDTNNLPFITLTYAQSLDSKISKRKGEQTVISHLETKTMTHYLRSKHDGILVGINTVLSDNPSLNCKYTKTHTITPIIIDPLFKMRTYYKSSRMHLNVSDGIGVPPIIVVCEDMYDLEYDSWCDEFGISIIKVNGSSSSGSVLTSSKIQLNWMDIFMNLKKHGLNSIMIEGGAFIINDLLNFKINGDLDFLVNSLIVTVGPVYLGIDGVDVSPKNGVVLKDVNWWTGLQDSVLCARLGSL